MKPGTEGAATAAEATRRLKPGTQRRDAMRSPWALFGLVGLVLLAGCAGSSGDGTPSSTPGPGPPPVPYQVDGEAVFQRVAGLVTKPDGSPRYRVPGTADHAGAALWLADQMEVPGWTVAWQNFTGGDYDALDKGAVAGYADGGGYGTCSADEQQRMLGLSFSNLVATLPAPASDLTLVLGSHWESKRFASEDPVVANKAQPVLGANDGASGVGVLLQLLRELSGKGLPYTVQVVLFDGEDGFEDCHPLAGSLWFVHEADAGAVDRMLLLDMVGDPDARFIRDGTSVRCDRSLVDLLHGKAARHGLAANFPGTDSWVSDDHLPFAEAGIPAVDLIDYGRSSARTGNNFPPYWHTTQDTMANLSAGMLGNVASLVLDVMQDPEFTASWPGPC